MHFLFSVDVEGQPAPPTDVMLYNTSEAAFQHQPSATEHSLQRAELFFFSIICVSIHPHMHTNNTVEIRTVVTVGECFYATTDFHLVTRPLTILRNLQGKMGHAWS